MQLKLTLQALHNPALLPFNYQYPLSAAIYKIIQSADEGFATFLHNTGYGTGGKNFKLFTFSDLQTSFTPQGDRMLLKADEAELLVCFYVPEAAENFIKGLFLHQYLQIADSKSKAAFEISRVESIANHYNENTGSYILQPLSPIVVGRKNARGNMDYRSPLDEDFADCLIYNWLEKMNASTLNTNTEEIRPAVSIQVQTFSRPPKSRLITIKAGSSAETKVKGYTNFRLHVTAPPEMIELALGAGLGLHNAQGMGCVEVAMNYE